MSGLAGLACFKNPNDKTQSKYGYNLEELRDFNLHSTTHIDAPFHFINVGRKIHDVSIDKFQGAAVVINLLYKSAGERISKEDLITYDEKIKKGDIVLLCTGWGQKRSVPKNICVNGLTWMPQEQNIWFPKK